MLTVYSPATIPRTVTISSRIGEAIFFPLTKMKSFAPPRSSRSSTIKPASRCRYQAMLPTASCTNRSRSSGWLSGQSIVMMNSAFEAILPSLASGDIARSARKKRNATTCNALNNITLKGSKGSSRGYSPNSSSMRPFQRRNDTGLGESYRAREHLRGRGVEHVILHLQENRPDKAGERRVHRHRHAVAHQAHRGFHHRLVARVESRDRRQHDDEADDRAQQPELYERVTGE